MRARLNLIATIISGMIILAGCQTAEIDLPQGFAEYQDSGTDLYAVTPDAVRLSVRTEENNPAGSLNALSDTAKIHFESIGYKILKSESIRSNSGLAGRYFLTSVETMNGSYRYLTAFYLSEDEEDVYIIEAAGSKKEFEKYERDILNKIKTIRSGG